MSVLVKVRPNQRIAAKFDSHDPLKVRFATLSTKLCIMHRSPGKVAQGRKYK